MFIPEKAELIEMGVSIHGTTHQPGSIVEVGTERHQLTPQAYQSLFLRGYAKPATDKGEEVTRGALTADNLSGVKATKKSK